MSGIRTVAVVGLVALAMGGCSSTFGQKQPAVPSGMVVGGLVGTQIGRGLSEAELRAAVDAEFKALEYGRTGSPVEWRSARSGTYGEVVPGAAYRVNTYDCREYTHTIHTRDGAPEVARSTACRQADGSWRAIA
jgi:surface antigen